MSNDSQGPKGDISIIGNSKYQKESDFSILRNQMLQARASK